MQKLICRLSLLLSVMLLFTAARAQSKCFIFFDTYYHHAVSKASHDPDMPAPRFILGIHNSTMNTISIDKEVWFGNYRNRAQSEIYYELYFIGDSALIDVLRAFHSSGYFSKRHTRKFEIEPTKDYVILFRSLPKLYLYRKGT